MLVTIDRNSLRIGLSVMIIILCVILFSVNYVLSIRILLEFSVNNTITKVGNV